MTATVATRTRHHPVATVALAATTTVVLAVVFERHGFGPAIVACVGAVPIARAVREDAHSFRLPDAIVLPGLAATAATAVLVAAVTRSPGRLVGMVFAFVFIVAPYLVTHLFRPASIGFGDVKLAVLIAVVVGYVEPAAGVLIVFLNGPVHVLVAFGRPWPGQRHTGTGRAPVPFGPTLAISTAIAIVALAVMPGLTQ